MELLLLMEWCNQYDIPNDVIHYLCFHFYVPLLNARNEKVLIDEMQRRIDEDRSESRQTTIIMIGHGIGVYDSIDHTIKEMHTLLSNPLMVLDTRINDNRLEIFIVIIDYMIQTHRIHAYTTVHVLSKGLEVGSLQAFALLHKHRLLDTCKDVHTAVVRIGQKITSLAEWPHSGDVYDHMIRLIMYFLDNAIDEPLLEWLTICPAKTSIVIVPWWRRSLYYDDHRLQFDILCQKQRSPEMKNKRHNFILHGVYAEIV